MSGEVTLIKFMSCVCTFESNKWLNELLSLTFLKWESDLNCSRVLSKLNLEKTWERLHRMNKNYENEKWIRSYKLA